MDVREALRLYVLEALKAPVMKALVLDSTTVGLHHIDGVLFLFSFLKKYQSLIITKTQMRMMKENLISNFASSSSSYTII